MLTYEDIEVAKASGKLHPATPSRAWMPRPRAFLMSTQLLTSIEKGRASNEVAQKERWARLEGDILHFVTGGLITWNLMKWLEPHKFEHWTLRSKRPRPSLRVFGRFARPNVFVGTHVVERATLGGKWDLDWELEKLNCEDIWSECVSGEPFSADEYQKYITENARRELEIRP